MRKTMLLTLILAATASAFARDLTMTATYVDNRTGTVVATNYHVGDYNCAVSASSVDCYAPGEQVILAGFSGVIFKDSNGGILFVAHESDPYGACGALDATLRQSKNYNAFCAAAATVTTTSTFSYSLDKLETVPAQGIFRAYSVQHITIKKYGKAQYSR